MNAAKKIDPDVSRRETTYRAGVRMLESESDEIVTPRRVVWRLLQEAVQTQRAIKSPGPAPVSSGMPEVYHTPNEIFATEVEMAKDEITYPPRIVANPSSAALERFLEVMTWLRYIRGHNLPKSRRTIILLAFGASQQRVMDVMGYVSVEAVDGVRYRAISGIVERIKRDLPCEYFSK